MDPRQRLFIYDRREVAILSLLAGVTAVFAFTLGVHLGKRVGPRDYLSTVAEPKAAGTEPDKVPNRQEIAEQSKGVQEAADEALTQALHAEVVRSGVKLEVPRQVELPDRAVTPTGGATTLKHLEPPAEAPQARAAGAFTLQVGSHKTMEEAQEQLGLLKSAGVDAYLKAAELPGKGRWYRVYSGSFSSRDEAELAGVRYKAKKVIESFVVATKVD